MITFEDGTVYKDEFYFTAGVAEPQSEEEFIKEKAKSFSEKTAGIKPAKPNTENEVYFGNQNPADEKSPIDPINNAMDYAKNLQGIFSGEIKMNDPRYMETVLKTSMNMVFPMFGENPGTLGSFAGMRSKNLDKTKLYEANSMYLNRTPMDEIWGATGWFKGQDGEWRYKINSGNAKIKDNDSFTITEIGQTRKDFPGFGAEQFDKIRLNKETKLEDVLDHPELFKAYPEFKNIKIARFTDDVPQNSALAYWDKNTQTIHISDDMMRTQLVPTLIHELQHKIQDIEGFAKGGAPATDFKLNYHKTIDNLEQEIASIYDRGKFTDKDIARIDYINKVFDLDFNRRIAAADAAKENYMKLAGEVEARNAELQYWRDWAKMPQVYPRSTEDVPSHRQIVETRDHVWATPYGYGDPMNPPVPLSKDGNITQTYKAANDNSLIARNELGTPSYRGARADQLFKKYVNKDTAIGDGKYWNRIAEEKDIKVGSFHNGVKAARLASIENGSSVFIFPHGDRMLFVNGKKVINDWDTNSKR